MFLLHFSFILSLLFSASLTIGMEQSPKVVPSDFFIGFFNLPHDMQAMIFSLVIPEKGSFYGIQKNGRKVFKAIAQSANRFKISETRKKSLITAGKNFNKSIQKKTECLYDAQIKDTKRLANFRRALKQDDIASIEKELGENFLNPNIIKTKKLEQRPLWYYALIGGKPLETTSLLLRYGANPNQPWVRDFQGKEQICPFLHLASAAIQNQIELIELLLTYKADPNAVSISNGQTQPLLHLFLKEDNAKPLQLLLENGAKIDAVDSLGKTALECAKELGKQEMIDLLEGYVQKQEKN